MLCVRTMSDVVYQVLVMMLMRLLEWSGSQRCCVDRNQPCRPCQMTPLARKKNFSSWQRSLAPRWLTSSSTWDTCSQTVLTAEWSSSLRWIVPCLCRISPPHFLAECHKRRLNQGSFVLLCFVLFAFSELCLVSVLSVCLICLLSCIFQCEPTWMALCRLIVLMCH